MSPITHKKQMRNRASDLVIGNIINEKEGISTYGTKTPKFTVVVSTIALMPKI